MTTVSSWSVKNFKGVGEASLPIGGLSVLAGANSAGKSSLTQTLLLLAQSLSSDIVLNGPLVRFGSASDAINENADEITLSWVSTSGNLGERESDDKGDVRTTVTLGKPKPIKTTDQTSLVVSSVVMTQDGREIFHADNGRVESKTIAARNPDSRWGDSLLRVRVLNGTEAPNRTYVTFSGLFPGSAIYKIAPQRVSRKLKDHVNDFYSRRDEIPKWILIDILLQLAALLREGKKANSENRRQYQKFRERIFSLESATQDHKAEAFELIDKLAEEVASDDDVVFNVGSSASTRAGLGLTETLLSILVSRSQVKAWEALGNAFRDLRQLGREIRYMGPLREEPQVLSTTGGRNDTIPAGLRGEYTADLLFRSKSSVVNYVDPSGSARRSTLQKAVGEWAAWLGVGQAVRVTDQGKLGRGILVEVDGAERDLTMIGVGVSQLLPVITLLLAAPAGSVVIFEQPELHLHPAIQSRLANFFYQAREDISVVIETHSEYLITRLRRLRVERAVGNAPIEFVFAKPGKRGAMIEPLTMGPFDDITEWPEGFFDTQEEEDRRLLVALAKRAKSARG